MLNPWIFGLQSVHQAWQAQSAMAVSLVRLFGGGGPDQNTSTVDMKTQEDAPATAANVTPDRVKAGRGGQPESRIKIDPAIQTQTAIDALDFALRCHRLAG
jgi:hypothetical protein